MSIDFPGATFLYNVSIMFYAFEAQQYCLILRKNVIHPSVNNSTIIIIYLL